MDAPRFNVPQPAVPDAQGQDPRLRPTPDYGTLGPGPDVQLAGREIAGGTPRTAKAGAQGPVLAVVVGVFLAILVGNAGNARAAWQHLRQSFFAPAASQEISKILPSAKDLNQLDRLRPQKQAEALLELAVNHSDGAVEQILDRADHWRGKVRWSPQIANLTTAALNSNDMRVRGSAIE